MSLAEWSPAKVSTCRAERANGPRRVYWPSRFCPIRGRPVDPATTVVGCVEDCGSFADPATRPYCEACHRLWRDPVPF